MKLFSLILESFSRELIYAFSHKNIQKNTLKSFVEQSSIQKYRKHMFNIFLPHVSNAKGPSFEVADVSIMTDHRLKNE